MGTLETRADKTGKAFKSMWDAILDIGRPESSADMLASAQKAFDEADKKWQWYQSRSQRREKPPLFVRTFRAHGMTGKMPVWVWQQPRCSRIWKKPVNWRRGTGRRESSQLKYTGEAQKAYERLLTPLDKYTARQEELNKALKDGKILQAVTTR